MRTNVKLLCGMPQHTEAEVAFDMNVAVVDDNRGAETDSNGEVSEEGERMSHHG